MFDIEDVRKLVGHSPSGRLIEQFEFFLRENVEASRIFELLSLLIME